MAGRSFLRSFDTVLQAVTAAAAIAQPVVATLEPEVGGLVLAATRAAVGVEALLREPGNGAKKAAMVAAQTAAAFDLVNAMRKARGKGELSPVAVEIATTQAGVVVDLLNAVAASAEASGSAEKSAGAGPGAAVGRSGAPPA